MEGRCRAEGLLAVGAVAAAGALMLLARRSGRQHRLAMEELAHHQRLATIGTLTSGIAHEFNHLLTPIMGCSILAMEKLGPEETEVYGELLEIYNAARKAKDIVSRLSGLSRKHTARRWIAPEGLIRQVLELSAPARPPRVKVQTALECRCPQLYGDETQLSQLLLNLVLNAFHAMEAQGGTLTVSAGRGEGTIVLRVEDTGCGIPPEVLPHIFEPFFTTRSAGRGTGLGLAIARQVAQDHGGSIAVESAVGKGTCFTLTFPLRPREAN